MALLPAAGRSSSRTLCYVVIVGGDDDDDDAAAAAAVRRLFAWQGLRSHPAKRRATACNPPPNTHTHTTKSFPSRTLTVICFIFDVLSTITFFYNRLNILRSELENLKNPLTQMVRHGFHAWLPRTAPPSNFLKHRLPAVVNRRLNSMKHGYNNSNRYIINM